VFVRDTHYPALENEDLFTPEEKKESIELMEKECNNLLNEISRLDLARTLQDKRLTNVMQLVSLLFATNMAPPNNEVSGLQHCQYYGQ
jgi:hypothetical protein